MRKSHARTPAPKNRRSPYFPYILGGGLVLAAVVVVLVIGALSRESASGSPEPGNVLVPTERPAAVPAEGRTFGNPDAPVTIVEYLDFQCPFCRKSAIETMPVIEQRFIETGIAKLELRPIAFIGEESVQAAAAAECALDRGEFWAYHDILYLNQGRENSGAFSDERLKAFAAEIGLDTVAFNACLDSGEKVPQVQSETQAADAAGVRSVPTVLVNGVKVENDLASITSAIEQAVAH